MDLEKLDDLIRIYRNHSIDDFLSVWLEVSVASRTANDVPRAKADVVAVYVARLLAANDVDAVNQ